MFALEVANEQKDGWQMKIETTAALATIRAWDWSENFRGEPIWRSLSDAINALAFHGHDDAPAAILSLLCDGKLLASGQYRWRKYRGQHFQLDDCGAIPAHRWHQMKECWNLSWLDDDWPDLVINLPRLQMPAVEKYEWAWSDSRMSFAIALGDEADWGSGPYSEEWFSAWNLSVYPASNDVVLLPALPSPDLTTIESNRGRPPKWDWEGAMAHVVAVANTPDGLETGPGAQAAIERLIADHFTRASNDASAPCVSEIRKRASRIVKAIQNLKAGLTKAA